MEKIDAHKEEPLPTERSLLILFEIKRGDEKRICKLDREERRVRYLGLMKWLDQDLINGEDDRVCVYVKFKMVVRKKVNSRYVVENVLIGCEGAYVGNERDKRYNKYKESTLCKGM
nr:hypothetical protein [Tanacetum cinerariifolium]